MTFLAFVAVLQVLACVEIEQEVLPHQRLDGEKCPAYLYGCHIRRLYGPGRGMSGRAAGCAGVNEHNPCSTLRAHTEQSELPVAPTGKQRIHEVPYAEPSHG